MDIFEAENVLLPAHNVQPTTVFFDLDQMNYTASYHTQFVFFFSRCRYHACFGASIIMMLHPHLHFQSAALMFSVVFMNVRHFLG